MRLAPPDSRHGGRGRWDRPGSNPALWWNCSVVARLPRASRAEAETGQIDHQGRRFLVEPPRQFGGELVDGCGIEFAGTRTIVRVNVLVTLVRSGGTFLPARRESVSRGRIGPRDRVETAGIGPAEETRRTLRSPRWPMPVLPPPAPEQNARSPGLGSRNRHIMSMIVDSVTR